MQCSERESECGWVCLFGREGRIMVPPASNFLIVLENNGKQAFQPQGPKWLICHFCFLKKGERKNVFTKGQRGSRKTKGKPNSTAPQLQWTPGCPETHGPAVQHHRQPFTCSRPINRLISCPDLMPQIRLRVKFTTRCLKANGGSQAREPIIVVITHHPETP